MGMQQKCAAYSVAAKVLIAILFYLSLVDILLECT